MGAGPVGLLTAVELAQRKVKVHIIDRLAKQDIKTKAIGVAKYSFQVLPTPVVKQMQEEACKPKGMRIHEVVGSERKTIVDIKGTNVPAKNEYLALATIEQWKTEQMLEKFLNSLGVHVQRSVTLRDFTEGVDHVDCILESGQDKASQTFRARFVVGCDGGASFVRKKLGFEFQGDVAEETFVSAHCKFEGDVGLPDHGDIFFSKNVSGGNPLTAGMCVSFYVGSNSKLALISQSFFVTFAN